MLGIIGVKVIYTKKISQGNASVYAPDLYLGNWAYLIGSIFIIFSIIALLKCIKR